MTAPESAHAPARPSVALGDVVIIGGGCYGSFYTGQLLDGRARDLVSFTRLLVVDRDPGCRVATERQGVPGVQVVESDWSAFLDGYLAGLEVTARDVIVPSPFMPHLFREWLLRRAAGRWPGRVLTSGPLGAEVGTPYERAGHDAATYLSWADWICPTHCTEPALCPAIKGPRTWTMPDTLGAYAARTGASGPLVFEVRHLAHGVGGFHTQDVLAADRGLAEIGARGPADVVVATSSHCHAAAGVIRLGPLVG